MLATCSFERCPAPISGSRDDGDLPFHFEPPANGGHLRIVQSDPKPADYDPSNDKYIVPPHPPKRTEGGTWERGGQNLYVEEMQKNVRHAKVMAEQGGAAMEQLRAMIAFDVKNVPRRS